ncbi:EI24 domain-containing protein [Candidatus Chloroploca sp. M-50]|uniref:EI24 domain-containing protein n=1 Tax=Candidatus Chloroploca mongolica TaxID=2528176 RepID=A0ABS4D5G5_9CHLR|nr:EI24 domain-containing protein [Candidatus Chloroploca mongolica]MBP1464674.1 EI24 domain-containing protein [Candidatus Chloroploca mongolica]
MDLLAGVIYPFRALQLINQTRRLWGYIVIPVLVNLVVGALLYLGLFVALMQQLQARLDQSTVLSGVVLAILGVVLAVGLAITIGFLLVRFGVVLGAPWYSQLSEELERMILGDRPRPAKPKATEMIYDVWRALLFEGKKLLLLLVGWLCTVPLLLIPGLGGGLFATLWFGLGGVLSCLDFFDGPQERRRFSFRQKLGTVRATMPASLSFGVVAFVLVSIPLVNLFAIPLCVVAGNLFVLEQMPERFPKTAAKPEA